MAAIMMAAVALSVPAQTGTLNPAQSELPSVKVAPPPIAFEPWRLVERTEDTDEYLAEFPSPLPVGDPVNCTVPLRILVPRSIEGRDVDGPLPVVLILHYWGARDLRLERSLAAELNARGVAAAIMTLPYHLSRTPPGYASGELAVRPDPAALRQMMTQSALDLRRSLEFLRSRPEFDRTHIGIAGISLGAIVASLGYALEPDVTVGAFLLGGIDLAQIVWNSSRLVQQRDRLRSQGYTEERLRRELISIEPGTYLSERPTGQTLVVRGSYDTVIPAGSSQALVNALPEARVLTIDTGHYGGIFVRRRLVREMATFLGDALKGNEYRTPREIIAPTVRVGLMATAPEGLNVAVGLDVARFDRRGRGIASALLTPRGPRLFVGFQAAPGLRFGVSVGPNRVGFGGFYSVVL